MRRVKYKGVGEVKEYSEVASTEGGGGFSVSYYDYPAGTPPQLSTVFADVREGIRRTVNVVRTTAITLDGHLGEELETGNVKAARLPRRATGLYGGGQRRSAPTLTRSSARSA